MNIADWDQEIDGVLRDIQALKAAHRQSRVASNRPLIARKVAVIQAQIHLEVYLEKIKKLTERDYMMLPRERAILHWGALFHGKMVEINAFYEKLMTRKLWLKLISTRLNGTETEEIDPDTLVEMALRQASLAKTEKFLAERLMQVRNQKRELARRHGSLDVAHENLIAAGTMQSRLGVDLEDALRSPHHQALAALLHKMIAPGAAQEAEARLLDAQRKYAKRTTGLMSLCRNVVIGAMRNPATKPSRRTRDKFAAAMRQLDDLETETRAACDDFTTTPPPAAHPTLRSTP